MNEQHGNHPDQRIRQTLDTLPDAPPPGSTFDSAKLWERLRPELSAQPLTIQAADKQVIIAKKRPVFGWWLAAASVVALVGWFWWSEQTMLKIKSAARRSITKTGFTTGSLAKTNTGLNPDATSARIPETVRANARPNRQRPPTAPTQPARFLTQPAPDAPTSPFKLVADVPGDSATNTAEDMPTSPSPVVVSAAMTTPKPAVANVPKRRFRVVHANELAAEDESTIIRYRADHFVRLGTGGPSSVSSGSTDDLPTLLIPINRKSIQ